MGVDATALEVPSELPKGVIGDVGSMTEEPRVV